MVTTSLWERLGRRLTADPRLPFAVAIALILVSLTLAFANERMSRSQTVRETQVQAEILASSVAAPIAFDDRAAAQEYIDALRTNPAILAAAAYGEDGRQRAGFAREGSFKPPERNSLAAPRIVKNSVIVTAPVLQNGTRLGSVYLSTSIDPWTRRISRYVGIAIVVLMASMLVAGLGASYSSVAEAHRRLLAESEERRRIEETLRQTQKMEALGKLTGGVAHDFNNLLMVASSGLELLDRTDDPVKRERLKGAVRSAIDRGAKLTQQLLAFARRSAMHPETIDLRARLAGLRDMIDRSLGEKVTVELALADDLWPVEVDPPQFDVALLNIAVNARDAMPNGGRIRIEGRNSPVGDEHQQDMVVLTISDEGIGMDPDIIGHVFEPFFTTKGVGEGTGLGLSQVYGFVTSSGGTVGVSSEIGRGTTLTISLPRCNANLPTGAAETSSSTSRAARRRHILVAEDDNEIAEMVGQMLSELGYDSTRAPNGSAALSRLENGAKPDALLSDMVMPGEVDGLELARRARQIHPKLPVVLVTGYSPAAGAAAEAGLPLLRKPFTMEQLDLALVAALQDHRSA